MLASELAGFYATSWVPEYAREYLELNGPEYKEEDIFLIAKGQLEKETQALSQAYGFLFCDTEFLVTKIWSEVRFGRCNPWITRQVEEHLYDLYLLCDIDLPWEYDPLREHPEMRKELFELYYNELKSRGFPFFVVSGSGTSRLKNATRIIAEYFKES